MDIVITILLILGFTMISVSWLKTELRCPPPRIVYRYVPKHTLDVQFGAENSATEVFKDMFEKGSPWIGGYEFGSGKTYLATNSAKR